jgi:selenide,water dikinase
VVTVNTASPGLAKHEIVLLGVGHTNAHIVRMWAMNPIKDARLTCIANHSIATYSGMLPAVLAGLNQPDDMGIDLVQFCSIAGARLILGDVTGVNVADSSLSIEGRTPVHFDVLSIGIGSVPNDIGIEGLDAASLVRIKPMQTFLTRLERRLGDLEVTKREIRVVVVGSGVAGVEVLFCLGRRLEARQGSRFQFSMVTRSEQILSDALPSTRRRVEREMQSRNVALVCGQSVQAVGEDHLVLENGEQLPADVVIWATGARAPDLLSELDLPRTRDGFLSTDRTLSLDWKNSELQQPRGSSIFAVGDTGTMVGEDLPKAGVYAVRQGPFLWKNIKRAVTNRRLIEYRPQRNFLRLINKGDGTAIGQWNSLSFEGAWVWRLKNRIDSKFMEKFRLEPMEEDPDNKMQCHGCGCKLGIDDLQKSFESMKHGEQPLLDDAVQIVGTAGRLYGSTDFFTDPLGDAYQFGRVTALHASSDLLANGADVEQAFANVVVEEGDSAAQQRWLQEFTEGANREFRVLGASIVGGHTIVGPRAEAGFTVVGSLVGEHAMTKSALEPGDRLYLTKALGIGVLLLEHFSICYSP